MSSKKGHRKGKNFAAKYLASVNHREFSPRIPLSEETKQIIKDCVREISGRKELTKTVCPNCKQVSNQLVEIEYLEDNAWRNSNGSVIINCDGCRR